MANLLAHELDKDFGLYHVLGILGDGSMGRMYLAERRADRRSAKGAVGVFALKSFASDRPLPERAKGALLSDVSRALAALVHPGIVAISEVGELDGRTFVAMQYLPGETLATILASASSTEPGASAVKPAPAPIPPEIAAGLIQQALDGTSHAHEFRFPPESGSLAGSTP